MSNWGSSKKRTSSTARSSKSSGSKSGSSKASPSKAGSGKGGSGTGGSSRSSSSAPVRDATPPDQQASRRTRANAEMREAIAGREHEFLGLVLIGAAILLGLAMYFDLAGPLGRGVETVFGWLAGLGRYALPVVLIGASISIWHILIERFPSLESSTSCDPANPCSLIWVERFGYLTIPTMALSAFALIATLLLLAKEIDA